MTRPLTDTDRLEGFLRATTSMSGAKQRWAERAERGLTEAELAEVLAYELGILGGSCGPGVLALTCQGTGLTLWVSREIHNLVTIKPTFEGKTTIAMARHVYIPRAPLVERRLAHAVLPAEFRRAQPGLVLLQNANDLFFAESAALHRPSPLSRNRLTSECGGFWGAGHGLYRAIRSLQLS